MSTEDQHAGSVPTAPVHGVPSLGDELQRLVDAWAARLQRSVAIDDTDMNLLAASGHYGDEDPARIRAVLGRGLDPQTIEYLLASGMRSQEELNWVSGVPELGLKTRLFIPVRCNGVTLGRLCLIDPDESADEEVVEAVRAAADEAGLVLYRRLILNEWERKRDEAVLRDLFAADASARERAIREINESGLLDVAKNVTVLVVQPRDISGDPGRISNTIASALDKTTRSARSAMTLTMASGRQGVLLVTTDSSSGTLVTKLSATLARELASTPRAADGAQRFIVGVSNEVPGLTHAHTAYEQAVSTTRAAALLPGMGDVARWDELGVYAVLMRLPTEELITQVSSPAVIRLSEHKDEGDLANTAETFLDCAGDTRRAAELLHVHRSTLYYRLKRIEQVTGLDLSDGGDRLVLHLGLKAQRLARATLRS